MINRVYTVPEVAELLQLHPLTVYRKIARGKIQASNLFGCIRVTDEQLAKSLEKSRIKR